MIEFKQIIGRGTRLFEGKEYFTIYDFVGASQHFLDPEWDGEPEAPEEPESPTFSPKEPEDSPTVAEGEELYATSRPRKIRIKLYDGKEIQIQHMIKTSFWDTTGRPISAEEFLKNLFGSLPKFFEDEETLRKIWSNPSTRKTLLEELDEAGYGKEQLEELRKLIDAEESDIFDVLEYIAFAVSPITRRARVERTKENILLGLGELQQEFIGFVLDRYIHSGVEELAQEKLPDLLKLRYGDINDALQELGSKDDIKRIFIEFQEQLYTKDVV